MKVWHMKTRTRLPLAFVLILGIVVTCLQTIYSSIFISRWGNEDEASRQLQTFVQKQAPTPAGNNWTEPKNFRLLPKRLITVFGLESSGTSLIAETLAKAVGADIIELFQGLIYRTYRTDKRSSKRIMIQHISEPWGFFHDEGLGNQIVVDIEVLPPYECFCWPHYYQSRYSRDLQKSKAAS